MRAACPCGINRAGGPPFWRGRAGGGVRRARVQAAALPAVDPANMLAMDPSTRRRSAQGPCERQVEIYNGFSPCKPAKRWISQPLARGGVVPPAGRRVWGPTPPAKTTCPQQRRRHRGFRVSAPVALLRTCVWGVLRHQGDEGPSNDALRAGFSTRPSRCGCAGYTCARGRCPSRADGRPGRR